MKLVLDWDGTVTEVDSLHAVLLEFGDRRVYEHSEEALGRRLTLHEVIAREFVTVRAPLDAVREWVAANVRVRRGFHEVARDYRPLVVSGGFHELIEPVLEREELRLEVLANRLDPRPDGWRPLWRDEAECGVCGEPCKRATLAAHAAAGEEIVFVGDGYSDRCAALAADRVFARANLARYLDRRGVRYEPFTDFCALASRLDPAAESPCRS
jgi:HAD superfamily phosphoserine phosphatase-like hydrolase